MPKIIKASSSESSQDKRVFDYDSIPTFEKTRIILYLNQLIMTRQIKIGDNHWVNTINMAMPLQKVIDNSLFEKISMLQPDLDKDTFAFMDNQTNIIFNIKIIGWIQEITGGNKSKNTTPKLLNGARGGKYYLRNGKKIYV